MFRLIRPAARMYLSDRKRAKSGALSRAEAKIRFAPGLTFAHSYHLIIVIFP